jgi:hypothetical protein
MLLEHSVTYCRMSSSSVNPVLSVIFVQLVLERRFITLHQLSLHTNTHHDIFRSYLFNFQEFFIHLFHFLAIIYHNAYVCDCVSDDRACIHSPPNPSSSNDCKMCSGEITFLFSFSHNSLAWELTSCTNSITNTTHTRLQVR